MSESLIGNLLVASSQVNDPILGQAVCLVVHQDEEQSIGIMLNRPIKPQPSAFLSMLAQPKPQSGRLSAADFGDEETTNSSGLVPTQASQTSPISDQDEQTLSEATQMLGTVHFGGPMSGPVVAVHGSSEFAEAETGCGIYVAAQKPNLEALVRRHEAPYRLIVGHIGWQHDQLQAEVDSGVWHIAPATTDAVFGADQDMWPRLIRRATARSVANWIGTTDVPMAYEVN